MEGDGKVYVLDPFKRVTGAGADYCAAFNPLADLNADSDDGLDMAGQIADALVLQQEAGSAGSHWTMNGRAFLLGLVLYVAKTQEPASRNLVTLRRLLLQDADGFEAMLTRHAGTRRASSDAPRIRSAPSRVMKKARSFRHATRKPRGSKAARWPPCCKVRIFAWRI